MEVYKKRDVAEKFFKNLKSGLNVRPVRHTSNNAIIGHVLITFLTNVMLTLTQINCSKDLKIKQRDVKLLTKIINSLTLVVIYEKVSLAVSFLVNKNRQILEIFGDFLEKYEDKTIPFRW